MRILAKHGIVSYFQLDNAGDIDRCKLKEFEFFKQMGIIDYKGTFKAWLRKFPKPVFIVAMENDWILGWVHIDEWGEGVAKDGNPVYVLRAIETAPELRKRKIGYRLVLLGVKITVGYMVVKPINQRAEIFFKRLGFKEKSEFQRPPLELTKHPTYRILSLLKKQNLIGHIDSYFEEVQIY